MDIRNRVAAHLEDDNSLVDDVTGLYNREGFRSHALQLAKLASRRRRDMLVLTAELGPDAAAGASTEAASLLHDALRRSDVIAWLGDGHFIVLSVETRKDGGDAVVHRLEDKVKALRLPLTLKTASLDPETLPSKLEEICGSDAAHTRFN